MDDHSKARYFLQQGQILYIGRDGVSDLHQHHMIQVGLSFDKPIKIRQATTEPYQRCQSFVVGSDALHQVVAASKQSVVFLWLDPESDIGAHIQRAYLSEPHVINLDAPAIITTALATFLNLPLTANTCDQADLIINTLFQTLVSPTNTPKTPLDPRIEQVIDLIKQQEGHSDKLNVERLAEAVYLSSSHLMHLFREQLGLPIRRYALWQRMLNALQEMAKGRSLTEAAHAAGFADSAHLTRTFRLMFGIKPSALFKNSRFVQVISCYSP